MASTAFRIAILRVMPPWLRRTNGAKVLGAIGMQVDALADQTAAGVRARFPGFVEDALPLIGRERRIIRGPGETSATYSVRLRRWWDDHRRRGGAYALLEQLFAYYALAPRRLDVVAHSGTRYVVDETGEITRDVIEWGADGTDLWAQVWLFHRLDEAPLITPEDVAVYLAIPREWSAGHVLPIPVWLIWPGAELWDYPPGTWDDPPDAIWDGPSPILVGAVEETNGLQIAGQFLTINGEPMTVTNYG